MKFKLLAGPSIGNVYVVKNWYEADTQTERETERRRETQAVTRVNDLLALEVPPKGLEATHFLLEVQMVQCWVEGDGSML